MEALLICIAMNLCPNPVADAWEYHVDSWEPPVVESDNRTKSFSSNVTVRPEVEKWRPLVATYFRAEDVDRALCLMWYESRGDPNAKNPNSTARGLMQVLASLWAPHYGIAYDDLYDPELNVRIASEIRDVRGGWRHWSPYKRGLCR